MLKLFIVDDEALIRNGLRDGFDWASVGYEVCGVAASGEEALPLLFELNPDVMITDVSMSRMDGIALLRRIAASDLTTKTVVLSGYDRFDYVQQAMRLGAVNYILKPLQDDMLYSVFDALRKDIEKERAEKKKNEDMQKIVSLSGRDIAERAAFNYLRGREQDLESVLFKLSQCGLPCVTERYALAALQVKGMRGQTLEALARAHFQGEKGCTALLFYSGLNLLLLLCLEEGQKPYDLMSGFLHFLGDGVIFSSDVRAFVSTTGSLEEMPGVYGEFAENLKDSFYYSFDSVHKLLKRHIQTQLGEESHPDIKLLLGQFIEDEDEKLCLKELTHYLNVAAQSRVSPDTLRVKCCEVYVSLSESLREIHPALRIMSFEEAYNHLKQCDSFEELRDISCKIASDLYYSVLALKDERALLIDKIRKYIDQNYNTKLSLDDLSAVFYLHPAYLSTLFCQKTGVTISAYIKNIRLEKAKKLLGTDMNIADISEAVGYSNYRYFSNLFKQRYNQSPMSYRLCKAGEAEEQRNR